LYGPVSWLASVSRPMSWNSPASAHSRITRSSARSAAAMAAASSATAWLCSQTASMENGLSACGLYRENRSAASTSVRVRSAPRMRTAWAGVEAGLRSPTSAEFAIWSNLAAMPTSCETKLPTAASE
jgi:hypothetical protein